MILRLLGRITSGQNGDGNGNFREENQDLIKIELGENIRL